MRNLLLITVIGFCSLILANCIQTPEPNVPKRVSFLYRVDNVGTPIIVDQDSIQIDEIKILADRFNLVLPDSVILQTSVDALALTYLSQFDGNDENVLSANIGFEDIDKFTGVQFFIQPPKDDDNIQDNDFFGSETNYSLILKGTFNSKTFTYQSTPTFNENFGFGSEIQLTNEEETLVMRVTLDIREIVIDPSTGSILNPEEAENKSKIDSLMQESMDVAAFPANLF